ncbi:MAG: hypothetical protein D6753_11030 [Planctomycetota bacterium]|nr:MAG: hypothetical protein D6753_11030 [Planctomycetota bacterium]
MKSERRHKLEQNVLADRLGIFLAKIRPAFPMIGATVAILIVGSLIYAIYTTSRTRGASSAWSEFYFKLADNDAASFNDVADMFPNSEAGRWARQRAADRNLARGIELLYTNRSEGVELIEQAIAAYEEVESSARNPRLQAFAWFGLAKAHEALGHVEEAKQYYEKVIASDLPPAILQYAGDRLAFLNSPEGQEFYGWFTQLNPQPAAPLDVPGLTAPPSDVPNLQFSPPTPADQGNAPLDPSILPPVPGNSGTAPDAAPTPGGERALPEIPLPEAPAAPADPSVDPATSSGSASPEAAESPAADSPPPSDGDPNLPIQSSSPEPAPAGPTPKL